VRNHEKIAPEKTKSEMKNKWSVVAREKTILNPMESPSGHSTNPSGRAMPHKHATRPSASGHVT